MATVKGRRGKNQTEKKNVLLICSAKNAIYINTENGAGL